MPHINNGFFIQEINNKKICDIKGKVNEYSNNISLKYVFNKRGVTFITFLQQIIGD